MPKKGSKTTKKTNPLTRGRSKPTAIVSDTGESEVSDLPTSPASLKVSKSKVKPSKAKSKVPSEEPAPVPKVETIKEENDKPAEDKTEDEGWRNLPSLIDDPSLTQPDEKFPYLTTDLRYREFELNERKELLQLKDEIDMLRNTFDSSLKLTRSLVPECRNAKVSDAIRSLGFPKTFKDLVLRLYSLDEPMSEPELFPDEDKPDDFEEELMFVPFSTKSKGLPKGRFPSPTKMAKYATPKNDGVFQFGVGAQKTIMSTNKAPRMGKPGEVLYSQSGSPILNNRRIQEDPSSTHTRRVELIEADGSKIEVDMVYRGGNDPSKLRAFKELANDVRNIAAARSTVKQNRVVPPRVNAKGIPQSASKTKNKPDWR